MKVTGIESFVLTIPTPKPIALEFPVHRLVVASVQTDEGLGGLGYSLAFGGGGAEAIQVYLETRLKPLLLGEDPLFASSGTSSSGGPPATSCPTSAAPTASARR